MPSDTQARLIAIGDIHGCLHALDAVIDAIEPVASDTIVVLGDFIDQGWETCGVIDRLVELERVCQLVCVEGNHEEMMLGALASPRAEEYWLQCGGIRTLNSYRFGASLKDLPARHIDFVRQCVAYMETEAFIFAHANFEPSLPMSRQPAHLLRWAPLVAGEVACHASGKTVIVGHTEQASGEILDLDCIKCIDTSCWRYGWLTALDVAEGTVWQASRFGHLRQRGDKPVGPIIHPESDS